MQDSADLESESILVCEDASEMKSKYLTFGIDKQLFVVPIKHVVQITALSL